MQVNTRSIYKRLWQGAVWEQGRACYTRSRFSGRVSPALCSVGAVAGWVASLQCWPGCCCSAHTFVSKSDGSPEMWQWSWGWGWVNLQIFWFYHLAAFLMLVWWEVGWGAWREVMWYDESPPNYNQNTGRWSREMLVMSDDDHQPHYTLVTSSTFINLTGFILLGWGRQLKTDIVLYVAGSGLNFQEDVRLLCSYAS